MSIFITADEHYGHANIIKFCNRPFADTDEMRETLIAKHNAKVGRGDFTIHVGDMFWQTLNAPQCHHILDRLNGRHAYIWGNHEEAFKRGLLFDNPGIESRFDWAKDIYEFFSGKQRVVLCHYAMRVWPNSHRGSWMLYGHSHNELPEQGLSFDIGVDGHNFEPWSLEEIAEKMKTKTSNHVIPTDKIWPESTLGREFSLKGHTSNE